MLETNPDRVLHNTRGVTAGGDAVFVAANYGRGELEGVVEVYDAATLARRASFGGHAGEVLVIAATSDGRRVATGDAGGQLVIWDGVSGQPLRKKKVGTEVLAVELSDDGDAVLYRTVAPGAQVMEVATGKRLVKLDIGAVHLVPRRSSVWIHGRPGALFERATGRWERDVDVVPGDVAFAADGTMAALHTGKELGCLRLEDGAVVWAIRKKPEAGFNPQRRLACSSGGRYVAVGHELDRVLVHEVGTHRVATVRRRTPVPRGPFGHAFCGLYELCFVGGRLLIATDAGVEVHEVAELAFEDEGSTVDLSLLAADGSWRPRWPT